MMMELADPVAVMMVAAHADTDADGGAGRSGAQQGEGKDRRDKSFHDNLLWRERFPTQ